MHNRSPTCMSDRAKLDEPDPYPGRAHGASIIMVDYLFQTQFVDWKRRTESLNHKLHPIVHAEIDINAPDWEEQLANRPHPADESGLRKEIEGLFNEIVDRFEWFDAEQRQAVIDLMGTNDSLMYSAVIDADFDTQEGFRKNMLLVVIEDQGKDTRDAIVALAHYRERGEELGFDVDSIFMQMAQIASDRDKYGWRSTRDLFLNH